MVTQILIWLKMAVSYVDLVRDSILVGMLAIISGYQGFFSDDVTLFPNTVILILVATVVVPLFISAVQTSARYPLAVFEFPEWNDYKINPAGRFEGIIVLALPKREHALFSAGWSWPSLEAWSSSVSSSYPPS